MVVVGDALGLRDHVDEIAVAVQVDGLGDVLGAARLDQHVVDLAVGIAGDGGDVTIEDDVLAGHQFQMLAGGQRSPHGFVHPGGDRVVRDTHAEGAAGLQDQGIGAERAGQQLGGRGTLAEDEEVAGPVFHERGRGEELVEGDHVPGDERHPGGIAQAVPGGGLVDVDVGPADQIQGIALDHAAGTHAQFLLGVDAHAGVAIEGGRGTHHIEADALLVLAVEGGQIDVPHRGLRIKAVHRHFQAGNATAGHQGQTVGDDVDTGIGPGLGDETTGIQGDITGGTHLRDDDGVAVCVLDLWQGIAHIEIDARGNVAHQDVAPGGHVDIKVIVVGGQAQVGQVHIAIGGQGEVSARHRHVVHHQGAVALGEGHIPGIGAVHEQAVDIAAQRHIAT